MVQPEKRTHQDLKYEDQSTGSRSSTVDLSTGKSTEDSDAFVPQVTADGSYTFFSPEFQEAFHSHQGAKLEAELKFVETTQLARLAHQPTLRLLDVCYGLGYNTAAALDTIWRVNPDCHVQWFGLELDPRVPQAAIAHHLLDQWPTTIVQLLRHLADSPTAHTDALPSSSPPLQPTTLPFIGHLLVGDARQTIQTVQKLGFQADAIFLDPFSPISCPQLWTVEFLAWVVKCLAPTGRLTTYSCSAAARTALRMAGLTLGSTPGVGRKSPGTITNFTGEHLPTLSIKEEEHLHTRSSIPYRDPNLSDNSTTIIQRRRQEQADSTLETTSQWKKRWLRQEKQSVDAE
ncbi:tRNA (5-methylaminomethyl-2-thiouridine)(34)-methyltransferase MnmD [Okeania sp. SIO2G5]|uniref:tRNA (5-methylaminomethyl-2-thiouridine)(34)-methyltransferase MnmD n=1 Tax=Okeania sp. SIO2G5 TaxID=2607796 RepID=UPI0013C1B1BE|nr:MnmC family methyltransferase [Okeania sp. SIO2G5]NEP76244.1 hypothetical protein [Okeania sp. SIO2G5]